MTWWNSVSNLNAIEQSATELLRFQCLTLWPWTLVALGSEIIFTKFGLRQLIRGWILAFVNADTLYHAVTLTFYPLTLKVRGTSIVTWSKSVRNLSEIGQSPAELSNYSVFAADTLLYAVTLTFDLWPWTFAVYRLWRVETLDQNWTQSGNPRRSYCDLNISPNDLERRVTYCARLWDNFYQVWPSIFIRAWIITLSC